MVEIDPAIVGGMGATIPWGQSPCDECPFRSDCASGWCCEAYLTDTGRNVGGKTVASASRRPIYRLDSEELDIVSESPGYAGWLSDCAAGVVMAIPLPELKKEREALPGQSRVCVSHGKKRSQSLEWILPFVDGEDPLIAHWRSLAWAGTPISEIASMFGVYPNFISRRLRGVSNRRALTSLNPTTT